MKNVILTAAAILVFAVTGVGQETCERHVEQTAGFSACVPKGWTIEERKGQPYKVFFAAPSATFTANINFRTETLPQPYGLPDYVDLAVKKVLASVEELGATSIKLQKRSDFQPVARRPAIKLTFIVIFKGLEIRSTQYILMANGNKKVVILTGTALEAEQGTFDPIFDRSAASLQMDQ